MASLEEENRAEAGSVLAQLHCEDCVVGSATQKTGPKTVSDVVKNSSTWTVTITEPPPTVRQAGARPGPTTIGSGSLLPPVVKGRDEVPALDIPGMTTVSVATGGGAVVVVGPAPMHEQALSKRYATSP